MIKYMKAFEINESLSSTIPIASRIYEWTFKKGIDDQHWYPDWNSKERWAAQQALNCALEVLDEYDY